MCPLRDTHTRELGATGSCVMKLCGATMVGSEIKLKCEVPSM